MSESYRKPHALSTAEPFQRVDQSRFGTSPIHLNIYCYIRILREILVRTDAYRGTSLLQKCTSLGPYRRNMPRAL